MSIALKRLVTVKGRVIDATSGEGVAGVSINAYQLVQNSLRNGDRDQTDAQGRYTVHVAPGKIVIQPSSTPGTHLGLDTEHCPQLDVAADRDWPDLKLARAVTIEGVVLDAGGKPVEGAEIHVVKPDPMGFAGSGAAMRTGPVGSFRLEQLDPDDTLPLRQDHDRDDRRGGRDHARETARQADAHNRRQVCRPRARSDPRPRREARLRGNRQPLLGQELRQREDQVLGSRQRV